jgi:DNA-binding NtrC family response regulator
MDEEQIHILLIDDLETDITEIVRQLGETMPTPYRLTHLSQLGDALSLLKENAPPVHVILLDLGLDNRHSSETIFKLVDRVVNEIPIIVITGDEEHDLALFVMNAGASDNMTRGDFRKTYGKLRDAIDFSLARHSIFKSARDDQRDSELLKAELMSFIGGGYSCQKAEDPEIMKDAQ